jgi:DNA-binding response OmpR family regulator
MTAKSVLIVDDEPSIVASLEFLMEQAGYRVSVARDGMAALECVRETAPDLILLDVMLPVVNGYEVCRRLRSDPSRSAVKIVLLTARGRDPDSAEGVPAGADAFLSKPFAPRELVAEVRRLLAP